MPRASSGAWRIAACIVLLSAAACRVRPDPIAYSDGTLVIENRTPREWRNVVITVNDHFRGGAASLPAGGRLTAPLSGFQTGFGQRFDRVRMSVKKVVVTAIDDGGKAITLEWDGQRMVKNET